VTTTGHGGGPAAGSSAWSKLRRLPLYAWVLVAVAFAIPTGLVLGEDARSLELLPKVILRALTAMATPLVVLAILSAIVTNEIRGRQGLRMMLFYLLNTLAALVISISLSNLIKPGVGVSLAEEGALSSLPPRKSVTELVTELVPKSLGEALVQNNIAQLVLVALAIALALNALRRRQLAQGETSAQQAVDLITLGFELMMKVLLWVVAVVPLAVFGVVAASVGGEAALRLLESLLWLILVVVAGLACQVGWYLTLVWVLGRRSPGRFLRSASDAMAGAFSTSSTGATMPITLRALQGPLGVSRASSQLAACVGTNFNNDGTALYQAAAVLFIAQALGIPLDLVDQILVALTTIVASVGAGSIPSGSFVTLPLIFAAVGLPADKIPLLLTVDWFLDRCRTTCNVLGDITVAVLLDRTAGAEPAAARQATSPP
jgi:DAACS family dicarboxylate/amino acid:cation (Na+ or H+) symporter